MNHQTQEPMRVLIVDDNPLDRADAKAALIRGSGRVYQFSEAASAEEALHLCSQWPLPHCIVLDLGLPDSDDFDVLIRLPRDEDNLLRIPVVVLTASVEIGLSQAALRAGAQDYVGKAWLLPETLTQAVENAIERLRMTRSLEAQRRLADTARQQALQLEAENRQIQEATRLKSQFLANMSHELRTPLAAVIGFSDLLLTGQVPPDSPKHRLFLGHIGTSGRHLLRLVNDVLDLSKVESGKFEFFPEPFDLADLVKGINDVLATEFQLKQLRVATDIESTLGALVLDPLRLRQVLYNYLSNAIKFTPAGGLITVRAHALGARHFRLEVEDTGVGIAVPDMARLFTAYQQLDAGSTKRHQGTGLGLALTRRLVMAQGGSVGVRSTPGRGSVFHLVLNQIHGADAARESGDEERLAASMDARLLVMHDGHGNLTHRAGHGGLPAAGRSSFPNLDGEANKQCADQKGT
ncbi:MAG: ATP-binding protein [Burkholderiaceae bacterium]|nr:ATP-binding protein [Burkholderiaceae bacterium]